MAERYDFVKYYKDDVRRAMAAALTGPKSKLTKHTAGSQKIPGYGDVFSPINKALAEERAREAREQAAIDKNLDAEIQKYANWEGF
jgi:hypothetical protein